MEKEDKKESLDPRAMSAQVKGIPKKLRGIKVRLKGDKETIEQFKDVAFLEMPELLIERDHKGPFLRVVTEKGHYRIRLEKEYRMKRQDG